MRTAKLPQLWVGFAWYEDSFEGLPPCFTKGSDSAECARKLERQIKSRQMVDDKWNVEYRRVQ